MTFARGGAPAPGRGQWALPVTLKLGVLVVLQSVSLTFLFQISPRKRDPLVSWKMHLKLWLMLTHCLFPSVLLSTLKDTSEGSSLTPESAYSKIRNFLLFHKGPHSQSYGFSSNHVQMWELGHKEGWVLNNWPFWIVVLEKTVESSLDSKEIKPVNPKENQSRCEELTHFKRPWYWKDGMPPAKCMGKDNHFYIIL